MARLLICSMYPLITAALTANFESHDRLELHVARSFEESVQALSRKWFDVILDIFPINEGGLCLARHVAEEQPTAAVVFVGYELNSFEQAQLEKSGVTLCFDFHSDCEHITAGVVGVLDKDERERLHRNCRLAHALPDPRIIEFLEHINPTDRDIMAGVWEGASDSEIANRVHLSVQTVRNRLSHMLHECGLTNRTQLARLYLEVRHVWAGDQFKMFDRGIGGGYSLRA